MLLKTILDECGHGKLFHSVEDRKLIKNDQTKKGNKSSLKNITIQILVFYGMIAGSSVFLP
jgi:hypothetical protein